MYWYKEEIEMLKIKLSQQKNTPRTFFYGSSSIRLWDGLEATFKMYDPINVGFGGSTFAACTWYFESVFENQKPESIIIYAGDNDLADNRHPEEIILFLEKMRNKIDRIFGKKVKITFLSIKPSVARWHLIDSINYTNHLVQEIAKKNNRIYYVDVNAPMLDIKGKPNPIYFLEDELHLSPKGYDLWTQILLQNPQIFPQPCTANITNGIAHR